MPPDSASTPDERSEAPGALGPRPMSRGASRLFVILSILFILAASIGGAYWLIQMAESNTQEEVVPADSAGGPLPDPGGR